MGKRPDGTPHKRPPTPSLKMRKLIGPMSLGNMRRLGPRSLIVTCTACGHHTAFNVDEWPNEILVPSFGPHIACEKCGHLGASVRPDWTQLRGAPAETRRR
jgi:hypothetical protein